MSVGNSFWDYLKYVEIGGFTRAALNSFLVQLTGSNSDIGLSRIL
jgi:hypothetical protein